MLHVSSAITFKSENLLSYMIFHAMFYIFQITRLESEFSSYKSRAHALLQKKDAELLAAQDSEQLKSLEEALKVNWILVAYILCIHSQSANFVVVYVGRWEGNIADIIREG